MILLKRTVAIVLSCTILMSTHLFAQDTIKFNFSAASKPVSGWTNLVGNPASLPISAMSSGITISSVAAANWVPYGSGSSYDGLGASPGTFFPTAVLANHWYQYGSTAHFNVTVPQFKISGLKRDSTYTIKMAGSSTSTLNVNPTQYTVAGYNVSTSQYINNHNNTADGATFLNILPDTSGAIRVYVNTTSSTEGADISGLTIVRSMAIAPPTISFVSPYSGSILEEGVDVAIKANASIDSGSISKVQFYRDSILLATDTTVPYSTTWYNPDPGTYQLTAKVTDYLGRTVSTTISVTVESVNYFWSTTGNAATKGDSNFIGTVDTNRLTFRTNNLERMTILGNGTIGIGTSNPQGYQLAVNGNAIFTKIKVKNYSTWPDYVFNKEFKLPSIDSLERFIQLHKHLPGVTSATEAKTEGLDIGDQQAALLKKIEELTLYLIEDHKQIEALKKQLYILKIKQPTKKARPAKQNH